MTLNFSALCKELNTMRLCRINNTQEVIHIDSINQSQSASIEPLDKETYEYTVQHDNLELSKR